jgi:hypothetical protein
MTSIVDRLRYLAGVSGYPDAFMCAVEAIEDLRAENANLRDDVHNQASDNSVLRQRLDIARQLLEQSLGHVQQDTAWSYEQPCGYLYDRIELFLTNPLYGLNQ